MVLRCLPTPVHAPLAAGQQSPPTTAQHPRLSRRARRFYGPDSRTPIVRGQTPRKDWQELEDFKAVLRADPCSWCGAPGGTVEHIVPKQRRGEHPANHGWMNFAGACVHCNGSKSEATLLDMLLFAPDRLALATVADVIVDRDRDLTRDDRVQRRHRQRQLAAEWQTLIARRRAEGTLAGPAAPAPGEPRYVPTAVVDQIVARLQRAGALSAPRAQALRQHIARDGLETFALDGTLGKTGTLRLLPARAHRSRLKVTVSAGIAPQLKPIAADLTDQLSDLIW